MYKNIVIVTSIINGSPKSVFSSQTRLSQTKKTIESVREKIPNCYIILAEIGKISEVDVTFLSPDIILNFHDEFTQKGYISNEKTFGEITLILNVLDYIEREKIPFSRVFKISGRYFLTDNFDEKTHLSDSINCMVNKDNNHDIFTTLWSFGHENFDIVRTILKTALYTSCMGRYLENSLFYLFGHLKKVNYLTSLGCCGLASVNGRYFEA